MDNNFQLRVRTTDLKNAIGNCEIIKLSGVECTNVEDYTVHGKRGVILTFTGELWQIIEASRLANGIKRAGNYC